MSHLLSSINPEAAAAIQPAPERPRLPGVGETVVYTMRKGHYRSATNRFPALVRRNDGPGDTLALTVFIDASDFADEDLVSKAGPGVEFHCWDYVERVRPLAERLEEPGGLRGEVKSLESAVFGEYDRPTISLVDILENFEKRLAALNAAVKSTRATLDAIEKKKGK